MRFFVFLLLLRFNFLPAQRFVQNFNENWQFLKHSLPLNSNEKDWQNISIPHTWNLDAYEKRDYDRNTYWYRKAFTIPKNFENKDIYLRFEAVNLR